MYLNLVPPKLWNTSVLALLPFLSRSAYWIKELHQRVRYHVISNLEEQRMTERGWARLVVKVNSRLQLNSSTYRPALNHHRSDRAEQRGFRERAKGQWRGGYRK
ncbi:hypothetical protein NQD34_009729 [Periophthalmus magnuspinnatus]|nr:hypothetical protein NQD34_009729 [Periophthalmus magnuspinnatus]